MPDEAPLSRPYIIQGGKVVLVNELRGDIRATGDVTVALLDTQPVSFEYVLAKATAQAHRVLDELQSSSRYDAATYEPRPEVEQHIKRFLAGPKVGLLIFGQSGVGKSNVLAHLCQQLRNDEQVVLFYVGSDFFDDVNVEQRILKDCGHGFKVPSLAALLDKLDGLNQTAERATHFVVLVDSVEHASEPDQLLRALDLLIGSFSYPWFKVIATLQTGAYGAITNEHAEKGWPQPIAPTRYYRPDDHDTAATLPGVMLGRFTPIELRGAWNRAQLGVSFKSLSEATRDLLQHPYFFKLFVELCKPGADTTLLLAVPTPWELTRHYYETRLPLLQGRHRNPSRVLLNELIGKLLEKRSILFSILELADDPVLGHYFTDYQANKPYSELLNLGILWEHALQDQTDVVVTIVYDKFRAYALYEYLRGHDNLTVDYLVKIAADLLPGPLIVVTPDAIREVTDVANWHTNWYERIATREFYYLREFWYWPIVEAIAHLLVDRWNAKDPFGIEFLRNCYLTPGAFWVAIGVSVKLIQITARTSPQELKQLLPAVIAIFPLPDWETSEARILNPLFRDLIENALTQEATQIVKVLLAYRSNLPAEIVKFHLALAKVHAAAGNDQQRLDTLLEANRCATDSGDIAGMGTVANDIGVFYNETGGDPETAIRWLEQGLEFAIKAVEPQENIAALHFNLGVALAHHHDLPRALSHLEQSLSLTDIKKTPSQAAQILVEIGKVQEAQRNFDEALSAYKQAIPWYEANENPEQVAGLAMHIGGIFMMTRQFPQAAAQFRRCLELLEIEKDNPNVPPLEFSSMANLALALAGIEGSTAEATIWFQKASEYHANTGLPLADDYFIAQLNFARFLAHIKKYTEATAVYLAALRKLGPDGDEVFRHTLGVELGSVYVKTGDYELAVKYITDGLPFFEATRQERALADLYEILGNAYREQGLDSQATEYYRKSYPLLLKFGMNETAAKVEAYLAEA